MRRDPPGYGETLLTSGRMDSFVIRVRSLVHQAVTLVGALALLAILAGFTLRRLIADQPTGVVLGPSGAPLAGAPVFLSRGYGMIERVTTDSAGRFTFRLEPHEIGRSMWLICAPGGIPAIDVPSGKGFGPVTYGYTEQKFDWNVYRQRGWYGPIPRECPQGADAIGWRYPPSAGLSPYAVSRDEPRWDLYERTSRR